MNINLAAANLAKAIEYEKSDFSDTLPIESFQIYKISAEADKTAFTHNDWVEVRFMYRIFKDIED
jgi:hypothetical protein